MPEQARHFVIASWLSATAPPYIDITTAALPVVSSSTGSKETEES